MPYKMVHLSSKIVRVVCAIINLSSPLFKDDKFINN